MLAQAGMLVHCALRQKALLAPVISVFMQHFFTEPQGLPAEDSAFSRRLQCSLILLV